MNGHMTQAEALRVIADTFHKTKRLGEEVESNGAQSFTMHMKPGENADYDRFADAVRIVGDHVEAEPDQRSEKSLAAPTVAGGVLSDEQISAHILNCWSCSKQFTMGQRTDADGNCPHCGAEYELSADEMAMVRGRKLLSDDTEWLDVLGSYARNPSFDAAKTVTRYADDFHSAVAPLYAAAQAPVQADGRDEAVKDLELQLYHDAYGTKVPTEAAIDVLAERRRQVEKEGWTPASDDKYTANELAQAAAAYLITNDPRMQPGWIPGNWPWSVEWWKPTTPRRNLVKAGALILAEIERLDRASTTGDAAIGEKGNYAPIDEGRADEDWFFHPNDN